MLARSWIALLLLANYLFVVGLGCMSRPEDQLGFVRVQTDVDGHDQQCRYLRLDGLEEFLLESLASRYQDDPETPTNQLFTVISGIDAHSLPTLVWPGIIPDYKVLTIPFVDFQVAVSASSNRVLYPPPKVG